MRHRLSHLGALHWIDPSRVSTLAEEVNETKRQTLLRLLAEEEAKLAALDERSDATA